MSEPVLTVLERQNRFTPQARWTRASEIQKRGEQTAVQLLGRIYASAEACAEIAQLCEQLEPIRAEIERLQDELAECRRVEAEAKEKYEPMLAGPSRSMSRRQQRIFREFDRPEAMQAWQTAQSDTKRVRGAIAGRSEQLKQLEGRIRALQAIADPPSSAELAPLRKALSNE